MLERSVTILSTHKELPAAIESAEEEGENEVDVKKLRATQ